MVIPLLWALSLLLTRADYWELALIVFMFSGVLIGLSERRAKRIQWTVDHNGEPLLTVTGRLSREERDRITSKWFKVISDD